MKIKSIFKGFIPNGDAVSIKIRKYPNGPCHDNVEYIQLFDSNQTELTRKVMMDTVLNNSIVGDIEISSWSMTSYNGKIFITLYVYDKPKED